MIDSIITFSIRHRMMVIAASIVLAILGIWAAWLTPVDAIPDLSENQVIVFTDWKGHGPREIEDQVTYPLALGLQGVGGVRVVRSSSDVGFSMISVIFEDRVAFDEARRRVAERLATDPEHAPRRRTASLAPDCLATGQIFWYTVEGETSTSAGFAPSRTGTCARSSTPLPAWPRSRALAAFLTSTRLPSIPGGSRRSASRSTEVIEAVAPIELNSRRPRHHQGPGRVRRPGRGLARRVPQGRRYGLRSQKGCGRSRASSSDLSRLR